MSVIWSSFSKISLKFYKLRECFFLLRYFVKNELNGSRIVVVKRKRYLSWLYSLGSVNREKIDKIVQKLV